MTSPYAVQAPTGPNRNPQQPTKVDAIIIKQLLYWLANISQHFGWNYYKGQKPVWEDGNDIGMPMGTPVYSLTDGQVIGAGYYGGGGVVSVEQTPTRHWYYQHLDDLAVTSGYVHRGDLVGWSGGQLSGGHHPATCCSNGPHIEVGINPPFGGIWGPVVQGGQTDPNPVFRAMLEAIYNGGPIPGGPSGPSDPGTTGDETAAKTGCLAVIDNVLQWVLNPLRIAKFALGVLLVLGAVALIIFVRVGPESVEATGEEPAAEEEVATETVSAPSPTPPPAPPEEPVYFAGRKGYLRNGRFVSAE